MKMTLLIICTVIIALAVAAHLTAIDWKTAPRDSVGIAPLPSVERAAVVQVYAARAINWRGWFSVHTWIATKEKGADHYDTYHVAGWQLWRTGSTIMMGPDIPDRSWFGAKPYIVESLIGPQAEAAIPKIKTAVTTYSYDKKYWAWPGPNSNTFISHIIRETPELKVELPPNAIGKDWLNNGAFFARSETGTGYQFSLFGILGITVGKAEGLEIDVLGLSFGVDVLRPALKLPIIGRIGLSDQ